ncbi:MAG: thioesterase [Bacteroidetes bacterium HGW-Bacteroidetes-21]|nr:MAG: thioesterase [Bacteroidetes bacterium HGW-Bacteroidetes-21]
MRGSYTETVTAEKTARHYGSGMVEVLATPAMIAAMEKTCMESVSPYLPEGMQTVGTYVQVSHIKATRIGLDVAYHAVLTQINGNELTFEVNANDTVGEIGSGIHKRFIINVEKFLKKLEQ